MVNFNPRSREGSDLPQSSVIVQSYSFQSTLPRRERRFVVQVHIVDVKFQSTLPRRERHTRALICRFQKYFNPRSREGSDSSFRQNSNHNQHFNPRSREGSDLPVGFVCTFFNISIHAPAKGATPSRTEFFRVFRFQSTLPRRERLEVIRRSFPTLTISIHAPAKGATRVQEWFYEGNIISIHAPAKGATLVDTPKLIMVFISIHAPAKGATAQSCTVYG